MLYTIPFGKPPKFDSRSLKSTEFTADFTISSSIPLSTRFLRVEKISSKILFSLSPSVPFSPTAKVVSKRLSSNPPPTTSLPSSESSNALRRGEAAVSSNR